MVFRVGLKTDYPLRDRPVKVAEEIKHGVTQLIKNHASRIEFNIVEDSTLGVAALIWKDNVLALTDGKTVIVSDISFVSKGMWNHGIDYFGHKGSYMQYEDHVRIPKPLRDGCNGDGTVTIEDIAAETNRTPDEELTTTRREFC